MNNRFDIKIAVCVPSLLSYTYGGGHWAWAIQYFHSLQRAGCKVLGLFVVPSSGDLDGGQASIMSGLSIFKLYCQNAEFCVILTSSKCSADLATSHFYGMERSEFEAWAKEADLLWNLAGALPKPFLTLFRRKVFVDGDPGHIHVSALTWDLGFNDHDSFLSVGLNLGYPDCQVPLHGKTWIPFPQIVHLDLWDRKADPGPSAHFTSISHWNWCELEWNGRRLSLSKREAYLELLRLPSLANINMGLAINKDESEDAARDQELFTSYGWKFFNAWQVAGNVCDYKRFISSSRAEICAPKPIYTQLNTGWFSDRSAGYLATGRPVLMKETGLSAHLPTGEGLVTFQSLEEAAERAKEISADYHRHSMRARSIAEEYLDSRKVIPRLLKACLEA